MRTKALFLTAAFSAAGIATSMAQVYSVNAVGYVNLTIPNGFSLIANPFKNATNTLNAILDPNLMPGGGAGVTAYRFTPTGFSVSIVDPLNGGVWQGPDGLPNGDVEPFIFGDGLFIKNETGAPFNVTFVGEVEQGTPIQTAVPNGFSIKSSKVPQAGKLQSELGYTADAGDVVYKWKTTVPQGYIVLTQNPLGGGTVDEWQDSQGNQGPQFEPSLGIAESAFIFNGSGVDKTWNRNFTVN